MFTLKRLVALSLFVFSLTITALAQQDRAIDNPQQPVASGPREPVPSPPLVTATATAKRVRFVSPGTVVQLRLEVYNQAGQKLFDTELHGGNVLDWHLQDGAGERLPAGSYASILTIKSLSGRMSQRVGVVTINDEKAAIEPVEGAQLSVAQQMTIGPMEGNAAFTVLQPSDAEAITTVTHDGSDGQVSRTRGALSFRVGDLFAGKDKEQMRLTETGRLGIGTSDPQANLDVAGTIRAERVVIARPAKPGSTDQMLAAEAANATGIDQPLATGSGTQDRIAKWIDNAGTLGDSTITELAGRVGIGVRSPSYRLVVGPDIGPGLTTSELTVSKGAGQSVSAFVGASGSNGMNFGWDEANLRAFVNAPVQSPITFTHGGVSERIRIATDGKVGIGTNNPGSQLDVGGDVNTSTQFKIGGNRVLSSAGSGNLFAGASAGALNTGVDNSFFGNSAGAANTTGQSNSFFGKGAGAANTTGFVNSFFGTSAGLSNTTGQMNAFFGMNAGRFNTTGAFNSFFGHGAGQANTTADNNSFFGQDAGAFNTTGTSNSFFGQDAGYANNQASNNSFFGYRAGTLTTGPTASANSFFGYTAGVGNSSGFDNSYFGASAGESNMSGVGNSFFGASAGKSNTVSGNSFFGYNAGLANTSGGSNSFFGRSAGAANTTASSNSFFVDGAGASNTTGDSNSFFGNSAGQANTTGIANSFFGYSAGFANTTGASNAFFGHNAGTANTTGFANAFFGRNAGIANTTGLFNSFFGAAAGSANTTGVYNSFFGQSAGGANTTGGSNAFFGVSAGAANTTGFYNSFFGNRSGNSNTTGQQNSFFGKGAG